MKHLEESIINYVNSKDNYMLLIDGQWGSGKTYYIQHETIPKLKEHNYKVIYSSVYGMETLKDIKEELYTKILYQLSSDNSISSFWTGHKDRIEKVFNIFDTGKMKIGSLVLEAFWDEYINHSFNSDKNKMDDIVLFIDDLERVSKNVRIKELLGFILTEIIERLGIRVIIVSNTQEIEEENEFNIIKEKVINRTISFSYENNYKVITSIISDIEDEFLKNHDEWIVQIIQFALRVNKKKNINLRTFLSVLSDFNFIKHNISENVSIHIDSEENKINIFKTLFLNIFVITMEYRSGRLNRNNLNQLEAYYDNRHIIHFFKDEEENDDIAKYYNVSNLFDDNILFRKSVTNYIMHGYFMDENYVSNWNNAFNPSEDMISNYDKLAKFREMSEIELQEVQTTIIDEIREEQFDLKELILIYNRFKNFEDINLKLTTEDDDLELRTQLITKLKEEIDILDSNYFSNFAIMEFNKYADGALKEELEAIKNSYYEEQSKNFVVDIFNGNTEAIQKYRNEEGIRNTNIFEIINNNDYVNEYILCSKNQAHNLELYVNSEYLQITNASDFHSNEVKDIELLVNNILEKKLSNLDKIDNYKIESLLEALRKLIPHLS